MNETEIREHLRDAIGESRYPGALASQVQGRLNEPEPERHSRAIAVVAAILTLAIVAVLLGPRLLTSRSIVPGGLLPPAASPLPVSSPGGLYGHIPPGDFDAAGLSSASALVTPFQLSATNGDRKITLIGAYADPARTVLLFRTNPDFSTPMGISISDDQGFINASSSGGGGLTGEYFYSLDGGPRPGSDGIAHLTVTIPGFSPNGPADGYQPAPGNWAFLLALKVEPSVALAAVPAQFDLGSWKVTTEAAEVTPSVIHVQALINGASVSDVAHTTVVLLDSSGTPVNPVVTSAAVTVPKQQLNSTNDKITRVNVQWLRPATAGTYRLQFTGGGGAQAVVISVDAPDPNAKVPVKGEGLGPKPTDFPVAKESLNLQGFLTMTITSARPNSCGAGTGPSGSLFGFGIYFQVDGLWYSLWLYSDPAVMQYSGPGTYTATAMLFGPNTQRLYAGTLRLTVTADRYPGPYNGSLNGTLDRVGTTTQEPHLSVSGTWTCTPGPMLGPG
jgi:hypothetical protein